MLLQGGQFNGVRLLAPRTVEMMRTNHVNPEPLKTMTPGVGWGMDFQVVMDAAAAGEPFVDRHVPVVRDRGHVVLDRSGRRPRLRRHAAAQTACVTTTGIHGLSRSLVYQSVVE